MAAGGIFKSATTLFDPISNRAINVAENEPEYMIPESKLASLLSSNGGSTMQGVNTQGIISTMFLKMKEDFQKELQTIQFNPKISQVDIGTAADSNFDVHLEIKSKEEGVRLNP